MQRLILMLGIMIALPRPADAQQADALRKGVRVEITRVSGKPQTGKFMVIRNDSLFYAPSATALGSISETGATSLAFADVKSVKVRRGRNVLLSMLVKGLIGTGIGAGTGAILGAATWGKNTGFSRTAEARPRFPTAFWEAPAGSLSARSTV